MTAASVPSSRDLAWEAARRKAVNAAFKLAARFADGGDRREAYRMFETAALDLAALDLGLDPRAEPWDPDRSRQLDLELTVREGAGR